MGVDAYLPARDYTIVVCIYLVMITSETTVIVDSRKVIYKSCGI